VQVHRLTTVDHSYVANYCSNANANVTSCR